MTIVHGSCVAVAGAAVLLRGPSGSGKSDLALRLIDEGAELVADDQVVVEAQDGMLLATAPPALGGRMEVRGLGIVDMPFNAGVPVALVVDLRASADIDRLPEPEICTFERIALPLIALDPFTPSAPAKLRLALARAIGDRVGR